MRFIIFSLLVLVLFSCGYDAKDFNFNADELKLISAYKVGDTIYFENGKGDVDTIVVLRIDTVQKRMPGFYPAQPASNRIGVVIKHPPVDRWIVHSTNMSTKEKKTEYQHIISLSKFPQIKERGFMIQFKDFFSFGKDFWNYNSDTLLLCGQKITNYYAIDRGFRDEGLAPQSIRLIYWTREYGLTAYKYANGECWVRSRR